MEQIFGDIEGINEGDWFINKKALREAGIHRMERSGIDGSSLGASSIVLNGGYIDDYDLGNEILYTGHGGNDDQTKKQIADQSWMGTGNRALLISEQNQIPVRVTRGASHLKSIASGYVYGGLYLVTTHKQEIGIDGYKICRFYLKKIELLSGQNLDIITSENENNGIRINFKGSKIFRNSKLSDKIKELYNFTCQICNTRLEGGGIPYAEAAHIRPIGRPHNGPDSLSNLLCLCPNHHKLLDIGGISINEKFEILGLSNSLKIHKNHKINNGNIQYHKDHIYLKL